MLQFGDRDMAPAGPEEAENGAGAALDAPEALQTHNVPSALQEAAPEGAGSGQATGFKTPALPGSRAQHRVSCD